MLPFSRAPGSKRKTVRETDVFLPDEKVRSGELILRGTS